MIACHAVCLISKKCFKDRWGNCSQLFTLIDLNELVYWECNKSFYDGATSRLKGAYKFMMRLVFCVFLRSYVIESPEKMSRVEAIFAAMWSVWAFASLFTGSLIFFSSPSPFTIGGLFGTTQLTFWTTHFQCIHPLRTPVVLISLSTTWGKPSLHGWQGCDKLESKDVIAAHDLNKLVNSVEVHDCDFFGPAKGNCKIQADRQAEVRI